MKNIFAQAVEDIWYGRMASAACPATTITREVTLAASAVIATLGVTGTPELLPMLLFLPAIPDYWDEGRAARLALDS